ncbi:MAG: BlaI/MecI/CopY family transcriptional regulator [Christensenellaceae bacterium]|nr:BlaI/MecI/CopY family transcriptional regulator [Christensenellaceae bacterium]
MSKKTNLSDGEWKLMKLLWKKSPRTVANMVDELKDDTAWTKGTVFMMLTRMTDKGIVHFDDSGRSKQYYPSIEKEDAVLFETDSFLNKVYDGSVGMMVASMVGGKKLSKDDINELYSILERAEKEAE